MGDVPQRCPAGKPGVWGLRLAAAGNDVASCRRFRRASCEVRKRYHDGSWADASKIAIGLVEEVTAADPPGEDLIDAMRDAVRRRDLLGWTDKAVRSLLVGGEPICIGSTADWNNGERYYVGGRHRALAMMQQGVRRTVTMRLELLDPDTGDLIKEV